MTPSRLGKRALILPVFVALILSACGAPYERPAGSISAESRSPRPAPSPAGIQMELDPGDTGIPPGYVDESVVDIQAPTAIAFTSDDANASMLIATQPGRLFRWSGSKLEPVLDLTERTCTRIEQGMLGVAPDPQFATNGFIYLYYTVDLDGKCFNRVSRFTLGADGAADASPEKVLVDKIPSVGANHNAGDVKFGKDGLPYISVGDSGCALDGSSGCDGENPNSRDRDTLLGKILRIHPDGSIPEDNPFVGQDGARCHIDGRTDQATNCLETFAWGLRNPFRMAFDPNADYVRFLINDPGQNHWEEINEGTAGADYGWNAREGHCANGSFTDCGTAPEGMTDPLLSYRHGAPNGCNAVTGGAFVPNGLWPQMDGAYLFADYVCGAIFRVVENDGEVKVDRFAGKLSGFGVVDMRFGPHESTQALYYTSYAEGGQVRRISFTGDDTKP